MCGASATAISAQDFWQSASYQRYGNAEFFAYSASALRLRELTLGYEIPLPSSQHVIKSAHLNLVALLCQALPRLHQVQVVVGPDLEDAEHLVEKVAMLRGGTRANVKTGALAEAKDDGR